MPAPSPHRCTDCGYAIDTLRRDDDCPECGRPVASSLPEARCGSYWQQGHYARGFVEPLLRPKRMWENVRPERSVHSIKLLVLGCVIAAIPMGVSLAFTEGAHAVHATYAITFSLVMAFVLVCLCLLEACGFAFIAWRRGWSRSIGHVFGAVSHAAPVWIVSGVLGGVAWQVAAHWSALWTVRPLVVQGQTVLPQGWIVWVMMMVALGIGLVCYEASAYFGMFRLRYTSRG